MVTKLKYHSIITVYVDNGMSPNTVLGFFSTAWRDTHVLFIVFGRIVLFLPSISTLGRKRPVGHHPPPVSRLNDAAGC
jgi:hypothetical protein